MSLIVDEIIKSMPDYFIAEAAKGKNIVYQIELTDDDNHYMVIDNGTLDVAVGDHDTPSLTLIMDCQTYVGMLSGEVNTTTAYMTGKIKSKGNIMLAMDMEKFFSNTPV